MGKYARGKHAVLIDDRSGFKIKYKDARTEWNGFRVYKGDWEPKQPQLDPGKYIEGSGPTVLYKPRPDQDQVPTTVQLGPLYGKWSGQCAANLGLATAAQPADAPSGFQATGVLNSTGIAIAVVFPIPTEAWQQATSALGSVTIAATDTQLSTEQVQDIVGAMFSSNTESNITAVYQDGDGTIDLSADNDHVRTVTAGGNTLGASETLAHPVTMSQMTSTLGTVTANLVEDAAGFEGTTTLGSVTLNVSETVSGIELGTMTATLGNTGLFFNTTEIPPGIAGTGGLGTLILNGAHPVTMSQMTSTLGTVTPVEITAVPVTMSGMTATLGTVAAVTPGYGTYLWGTDEWGK